MDDELSGDHMTDSCVGDCVIIGGRKAELGCMNDLNFGDFDGNDDVASEVGFIVFW